MTNEVKNVPELRFPEYREEWEVKRLGEIVDFSKGKLLGKKDLTEKDGVPCILYGELYTKYGPIINDVISRTNVDTGKLKKGRKNQILIPSSGETTEDIATASALNINDDVYIGGDLNILTPKNEDGRFISLSLNGVNKWNVAKFAQGKTVVHIYNNDLKKLHINLPTKIEEQQEISGFFNKLDRQIELEEQKLEKLEEQKKGYMQKVFSQEFRFKDENGNDYPEWEDKLISDIGKVITGNTPSKKENDYWNSNQYIWVTPTDISNKKNIYTSGYQLSQKGFSKARQLPKNTLLITCIASIGKNAILRIEGSCNQQINAVIPNDNYDVDYLYYAFEDVSKLMKSIAGKTATQIVNKAVFEKLLLNVPIYEEQQKISGFLNKVDILIDKQAQKIDELKLRKQGFLQKMFV